MVALHSIDWWVIGLYLTGLIGFSYFLSRRQHNREDYYVGGHGLGPWPIAVSTMATQCSTNSILGAPAFVAFSLGGGLVWLQYELAVPLAMIAIMVFLLPMFLRLQLISVYAYLERRFDLKTRLLLSGLFQFVRAFATAVTVYSIALVVELISGLPFFWSVLLIGAITLIYDILGGIKAVIYSDLIQLVILTLILLGLFALLWVEQGGLVNMLHSLPAERQRSLNFTAHGLGDGETFAFWPMLLGGFFLYVSYYGCDQSQVQRELCARNLNEGRQALLLNGLLRFPLVLLYCLLGVGLAAYAMDNPDFLSTLPLAGDEPNYNLVVPQYMGRVLPVGLLGLAMVALFAAAMSSLDSVINSLSAVTMEDFIRRFRKTSWSGQQELWVSRLLTLCWGSLTLAMSFFVGDIAPTVLEAINMIGSLINGPILAVFILGLLTRHTSGTGAIAGLLSGFIVNLLCWILLPSISWLWWNVSGFLIACLAGFGVSLIFPSRQDSTGLLWQDQRHEIQGGSRWRHYSVILLVYAILMFGLVALLEIL